MSVGPRLPRRSALALAATGLVAVAGCDNDSSTPAGTPDPDVALVHRVLKQLADAERLAVAAGRSDLSALHAAHIEALGGKRAGPAPGHASAAGLRTSEQRLQQRLADASVKAGSGALARLLASMSAAVSQRLAGGPA